MKNIKNKAPKVSVCVVTYNHEAYIRKCLESIVEQEMDFKFEVIVGDDCSVDGTRAIVQEFAEKYPKIVKPIFHEKNMGATRNYLSVISRATGRLVCNCDGDDYWLPSKLREQVKFMDMHPECNVSGHRLYVTDDTGKISEDGRENYPAVMPVSAFYEYGNFIPNSSTMFRASSGRLPDIKGETIDFLFHIWRVKDKRIGFMNQYFGVYRRHGSSMTARSHDSLKYFNFNLTALEEIHKIVKDADEFERRKFALCRACIKDFIANERMDLAKEIANNSEKYVSKRRHRMLLKLLISFSSPVGLVVRTKRKYMSPSSALDISHIHRNFSKRLDLAE